MEEPVAAEERVPDELVEPVVGGALGSKHLEGEALVGVLHHPRSPVPRRVRETQGRRVPIPGMAGAASDSLLVGKQLLHSGGFTLPALLYPDHHHLGDTTPVLHLQPLLEVESIAHKQLGVHLPQLLLQPLARNQAVDGKGGRPAFPGGETEEPEVGMVGTPEAEHRPWSKAKTFKTLRTNSIKIVKSSVRSPVLWQPHEKEHCQRSQRARWTSLSATACLAAERVSSLRCCRPLCCPQVLRATGICCPEILSITPVYL